MGNWLNWFANLTIFFVSQLTYSFFFIVFCSIFSYSLTKKVLKSDNNSSFSIPQSRLSLRIGLSLLFFFEVLFREHKKQPFLCGRDDKEEGGSIHKLGELNGEENELNFDFSFDFVEIATIGIKVKIDPYREFSLELISRYGFYLDSKKWPKEKKNHN